MNKLMPVILPTWGPNLVDVDPAEETALPPGFKVILNDPLFSDFLSTRPWVLKRITQMPSQITEVPKPDIILVSHNHSLITWI
ncbi:AIF_collapsed_G0053150.mRNA.1.CDS.1 [Saccharomyces cerevisiae]|nr:AIF_collapsed_G0053150.mRNA.1.CDS.1 [Saccharomyces cerevisiae]